MVDPDDSLFTYPDGTTPEDFQFPNHTPKFLNDVLASASQEVLDACGSSSDCIFDATETGNISVGVQTMSSNQQNMVEQELGGKLYSDEYA